MCDTFVKFLPQKRESFFAKNSDRHPAEPQFIQYVQPGDADQNFYLIKRKDYINRQLPALQKALKEFKPQYAAVISRPAWIWGAEMGVNEWGVAIGNEAVFSDQKLNPQGLLGMDILRLALHSADSALKAVEIIIELIENYGQGGNGIYRGNLKYHNSFLIKDFNSAYVLETAGKHWAYKQIDTAGAISNVYTIESGYDKADVCVKNFKEHYQLSFYNLFTKGNERRSQTLKASQLAQNLSDIFQILRSHNTKDNSPKRGMDSICMHSGTFIKSETTASMVVHYIENRFFIWVTNSPNPCVSTYFPIIWHKDILSKLTAENMVRLFEKNKQLAKIRLKNYKRFIINEKNQIASHEIECQQQLLSALDNEQYLLEIAKICFPKI